LNENRHGLIVGIEATDANGTAERTATMNMADELALTHGKSPKTLGVDKGYDSGEFNQELEKRLIEPHVPLVKMPRDMKLVRDSKERAAVAGMGQSRWVGRWKLQHVQELSASVNLVRMRKLAPDGVRLVTGLVRIAWSRMFIDHREDDGQLLRSGSTPKEYCVLQHPARVFLSTVVSLARRGKECFGVLFPLSEPKRLPDSRSDECSETRVANVTCTEIPRLLGKNSWLVPKR
jgi:hypothetical protein